MAIFINPHHPSVDQPSASRQENANAKEIPSIFSFGEGGGLISGPSLCLPRSNAGGPRSALFVALSKQASRPCGGAQYAALSRWSSALTPFPVAPARAARREGDAKEILSIFHLVSRGGFREQRNFNAIVDFTSSKVISGSSPCLPPPTVRRGPIPIPA